MALDVTEGIFAVLYVSIMALHVFIKRQFLGHRLALTTYAHQCDLDAI